VCTVAGVIDAIEEYDHATAVGEARIKQLIKKRMSPAFWEGRRRQFFRPAEVRASRDVN
jgi:hypothetical protein